MQITCEFCQWRVNLLILTYKALRCNALILSGGRGHRPDHHRHRYSTFAPFPDTCPTTNPRSGADQGQMYSTVVFGGRGRCPGANVGSHDVNWRAWLMDDSLLQSPQRCWSYVASFQLTHCQDSVLLQPAGCRCSKLHECGVNI